MVPVRVSPSAVCSCTLWPLRESNCFRLNISPRAFGQKVWLASTYFNVLLRPCATEHISAQSASVLLMSISFSSIRRFAMMIGAAHLKQQNSSFPSTLASMNVRSSSGPLRSSWAVRGSWEAGSSSCSSGSQSESKRHPLVRRRLPRSDESLLRFASLSAVAFASELIGAPPILSSCHLLSSRVLILATHFAWMFDIAAWAEGAW